MATENNKVGRPPRAKGESMQRLSVSIRGRYREALELIARHRRTSVSQALEYLIASATRDYEIDGEGVLMIADRLVAADPFGLVEDRLRRLALIPESLRKPAEEFSLAVLDYAGVDPADLSGPEAELFFMIVREIYADDGQVEFAGEAWLKARASWRAGGGKEIALTDSDGFVYHFDIPKRNDDHVPF